MKLAQIVIIYNPNSTGDSPDMAEEFAKDARKALPKTPVTLKKTKHAGHAEELAYKAALSKPNTLIVSVSGDGGYNEVINGALRAVDAKKAKPICAILPGGNANDHHANVSRGPLLEAIKNGNIEQIDVLQVKFGDTVRYAHSYVGLGLTPLVAQELNKHTLTALKEAWLALKTYWNLRPFEIEHDGKKHRFDSLLMLSVGTMAKYLTISKTSSPRDGKFEIAKWPHNNKLRLTLHIIRAFFSRHHAAERTEKFTFKTLSPQPMQLDGELLDIPKNVTVTVAAKKRKLRTVL